MKIAGSSSVLRRGRRLQEHRGSEFVMVKRTPPGSVGAARKKSSCGWFSARGGGTLVGKAARGANSGAACTFSEWVVAGKAVAHDEEHLWVLQAQAGDQPAFAALVERYWPRVRRWLHGLCDGRPEADDLTQEAFLKAWAGLRSFQAGTHFRAWLFRIARNCLVDWQRRRCAAPQEALREYLTAREPGPVATLVGRETQARVAAAVARLPQLLRAPFLLRTQEELGYREIAQVLELTEETVRWRVFKARQVLLQELGPYLDRESP
jgi:RNA polymerase sigma-70 factor (ECF subfamily)